MKIFGFEVGRSATKASGRLRYPASGIWPVGWDLWDILPTPTEEDFELAIRRADRSSVVMDCVDTMISLCELTPWTVQDANGETVDTHPVLDLLNSPTPESDGQEMLGDIIVDLSLAGDAYIHKVPTMGGGIGELEILHPASMEAKTDKMGRLSWWKYTVDGHEDRLELAEVIHVKYKPSYRNALYGRAPVDSVGPEIWLDVEAARMIGTIMKVRGMPGGFASFKNATADGTYVPVSPDDVEDVKRQMRTEFTGEKRGSWLVSGAELSVEVLHYDPKYFDMTPIYRHTEQRISSAFGLPATKVGLGAGTSQSKVGAATEALEKQAWETGAMPLQKRIARAFTRGLLMGESMMLGFDYSGVSALQEDANNRVERHSRAVQAGWKRVDEARAAEGLEVKPTDAVYLREISKHEVPAGKSEAEVAEEMQQMRENDEPPDDDMGDED